MKTVSDSGPAAPRSGLHAGKPRPGGSGEGARSALEQLQQQERTRNAQSPREAPSPVPPESP